MSDIIASEATDESEIDCIEITAVTHLKHADLYAAAQKMGGQAALSRWLDVHPTEVSKWINLKTCPVLDVSKSRNPEKAAMVGAKLQSLTGKSIEELFPEALRDNTVFLQSTKSSEKTVSFSAESLRVYAIASRERMRLTGEEQVKREETQRKVVELLRFLPERQRVIVEARFGINGVVAHQKQLAKRFGVTPSRIASIEKQALERLRRVPGARELLEDIL